MKFRIIVEPDLEEGGFIVSAPSLPGCHSQGETLDEAVKNINDAIAAYVEVLKKHKRPIPREMEIEVAI
jgi:predicted RNase H-like HicB family nuclease